MVWNNPNSDADLMDSKNSEMCWPPSQGKNQSFWKIMSGISRGSENELQIAKIKKSTISLN